MNLKIIVTDDDGNEAVWVDTPVHDVNVDKYTPWQEIRSNPQLAAIMAGADVNAVLDLPGEQVAWMHSGSEIEVTYKLRFHAKDAKMTEFKSAP